MHLRSTAIVVWLFSVPASADVLLRLDPGVAAPVSAAASDSFGIGFHVGLTGGIDVLRFLELAARFDYVFLSRNPTSALSGPGSVLAVGPALRAHVPWSESRYIPWVELALQYARTGDLDRLALNASAGIHFVLPGRFLFIGPWVGVKQVFHLANTESNATSDATVIMGGLSLEFSLLRSAPDRDGDGVPDDKDACPDMRGKWPTGCPDSLDSDGDGIPDNRDLCPAEFGTVAFKGCADPDPDHDGILGAADHCPLEPEDKDGYQDEDGCPDLDDDADGIPDVDDACPRQAGPAATLGCPDRDGDGVADHDDSCPDVHGLQSEQGCPLYKTVKVTAGRIELNRKLEMNGSVPAPKSVALLEEVLQALTDRSALCVRVEGHTEAKGKAEANLKVSQSRADGVRTWLMAHGISPSRISARGLGQTQPIADNGTADGREANRRIELVVVPCEVAAP